MIAWPVLVLGLSLPALVDCSAAKDLKDAASGCDEFSGGSASAVGTLDVDVKVKAFLQASLALQTLATSVRQDALTSCSAIATDLGVADTWSAQTDPDMQVQIACNAASTKIQAILSAGASGQASLSIQWTPPECTVDVSATATCQGSCSGQASCTAPDVNVACEPGQLSGGCTGMCSGSCTASATAPSIACEGSCTAECTGSCDAQCTGTCMGNCTGKCDGTCSAMDAQGNCTGTCTGTCKGTCDAMCKGKCEGKCAGSCTGSCNVMPGSASASCMGECSGSCDVMFTAPKCHGKVTPPSCNADVDCKASCDAQAHASAVCTEGMVTVVASASANTGDMQKLVATLQTNLPKIINNVTGKAKLAVDVAAQVASSGEALVNGVASFTGKAVACIPVAASASARASASISVSVMASASTSASCGGPSNG